jgi:hypothetical protein
MMDGDFCLTELKDAVTAAACMTELLTGLGIRPGTASRRRMFERLKRAGIDRSHWHHSPRTSYSREQLAQAVAASQSFAGVIRH